MNPKKIVDRHCTFCRANVEAISYKDTNNLKRYLSSFGKIVPRKRSGLCSGHQREVGNEIKRSRIMAMLPFVQE